MMDTTREPEYQDGMLVTPTDEEAYAWMFAYGQFRQWGKSDAESLRMANAAILAERTTLVENLTENHDANKRD